MAGSVIAPRWSFEFGNVVSIDSTCCTTRTAPGSASCADLGYNGGTSATPRVPPGLLAPVVSYFNPRRVILFGSHARGEARPDSDIDLLVAVDDDTPAEKVTLRAGAASANGPHKLDEQNHRTSRTTSPELPPLRWPRHRVRRQETITPPRSARICRPTGAPWSGGTAAPSGTRVNPPAPATSASRVRAAA